MDSASDEVLISANSNYTRGVISVQLAEQSSRSCDSLHRVASDFRALTSRICTYTYIRALKFSYGIHLACDTTKAMLPAVVDIHRGTIT